jgi:peptidyl-prolyl cis-trans isomerase A (cyclophilin A)
MSMKRLATITVATMTMGLALAARGDTTAKSPALTNPAAATATAPAQFKVKFTTTKGDFIVEAHRDWAPNGVDRFYNLVKIGFYNDLAFFRVIKGFMVQFGINGDPAVNRVWREAHIKDDPAGKQSNGRGMVTFAMAGPDTRTSQLFINYADNRNLDNMGFAPIGKVVGDGMKVVDAIEGMYGEGAPQGAGPAQGRVQSEGNAYLKAQFPKLDYIKKAVILP